MKRPAGVSVVGLATEDSTHVASSSLPLPFRLGGAGNRSATRPTSAEPLPDASPRNERPSMLRPASLLLFGGRSVGRSRGCGCFGGGGARAASGAGDESWP